jgi:hypothetical protein
VVGDFAIETCANVILDDSALGIQLKAHIADYHAARPNGKFIGYVDITSLTGDLPGYATITANDSTHRNWFVYRQGCNGSSTVVQYPECDYPDDVARDARGRMQLDISRSAYLLFIADQIAREAAELGMDGIVVDVVHEFPLIRLSTDPAWWYDVYNGNVPGNKCDWISSVSYRDYWGNSCIPIEPETFIPKYTNWDANWDDFFIALQSEINTTSRPNMTVYANVPREEGFLSVAMLPYLDGVMVEDFAGPNAGTNTCLNDAGTPGGGNGFFCRMKNIVSLKAAAAAAGKPLLLTAQSHTENHSSWCGGPQTALWDPGNALKNTCLNGMDSAGNVVAETDTAAQHQYMRFYLAAYYIMQDGNSRVQFDHPAATSDQYASMPWYGQFNCDLGTADNGPLLMTSGVFNDSPNVGTDSYVFTRSYSAGKVWLNTKDGAHTVPALGTDYWNSTGTKYPGNLNISVPGDSGLILYTSTNRCAL